MNDTDDHMTLRYICDALRQANPTSTVVQTACESVQKGLVNGMSLDNIEANSEIEAKRLIEKMRQMWRIAKSVSD